jgi:hypothetical protein
VKFKLLMERYIRFFDERRMTFIAILLVNCLYGRIFNFLGILMCHCRKCKRLLITKFISVFYSSYIIFNISQKNVESIYLIKQYLSYVFNLSLLAKLSDMTDVIFMKGSINGNSRS